MKATSRTKFSGSLSALTSESQYAATVSPLHPEALSGTCCQLKQSTQSPDSHLGWKGHTLFIDLGIFSSHTLPAKECLGSGGFELPANAFSFKWHLD